MGGIWAQEWVGMRGCVFVGLCYRVVFRGGYLGLFLMGVLLGLRA
jgi:hypothetical protein